MRKVLYTQRVEIQESYGERRDCADQQWAAFLHVCGFLPIPIPNRPEIVEELLKTLSPDGIVLTGGNDLTICGGNAPERDMTEKILIDHALRKGIPLLGVCRGMQMLQSYFGGELERVEGHVRMRHTLELEGELRQVNSYHGWGILQAAEPFQVDAYCEDGVIEAMSHKSVPIRAIMWHPEREAPFAQEDVNMLQRLMGGDKK